MRWILPILALTATGFADEAQEKKNVVPAAPIVEKPAEAAEDAAAELKNLVEEYNKAQQDFYNAYRKARAADPSVKYDPSGHPAKDYKDKFKALAEKMAGKDEAVEAWLMYANCRGDRKLVADVLIRDHIKSPKMADALTMFRYDPNGAATYEKIIAETPHHEVKGKATFFLAQVKMRAGDGDGAEKLFLECQKEYADIPMWGGRTTIGKQAEGNLFEARNLVVGKVAPDIEGPDLDGVNFKLSDYRGKVIFLDFWGDW
ncbi:MAG: peroxiredoxin family protein [Planctomycetota bacterium]|jgi:hypothetical protein